MSFIVLYNKGQGQISRSRSNIKGKVRGQDYKVADLVSEMCWLDDIVVDLCQNADKYEKKYNSVYSVV